MDETELELTVADLMTLEPVVVAADAPIEEAHRLLLEFGVSGLPVVDDVRSLVGVVSQTDFMHLESPDVRTVIHHKPSGIRVGEVMTRPAVTVLMSTTLVDAAQTMLEERVHRVVAIDGSRRPIGVLSAMDFVKLYAEG